MSNQFIENEKLDVEYSARTDVLQNWSDVPDNTSQKHNKNKFEVHNVNSLETSQDPAKTEENQPEQITGTAAPVDEWTDLLGSGAIMKKILHEGKPDTRPERNEKCTINYTCYLEDETIVETVSGFDMYLGESDVSSI